MECINFPFATPNPVSITEPDDDMIYEVKVRGKAHIIINDPSVFGDDPQTALRNKIVSHIFGCFEEWSEGKRKMCSDNCKILGKLLEEKLLAENIAADIEIVDIAMPDFLMKKYRENTAQKPTPEVIPETDENGFKKHGRLLSIGYNRSTHGMMYNSGSSAHDIVRWKEDGSTELEYSSSGGGMTVRNIYRVQSDAAKQLYDWVIEKNLAAIAELPPPPVMGADCITTATINMTFDDREFGRSRCEYATIQCGMVGTAYGSIESKLRELLDNCKDSGELVINDRKEEQPNFGGMLGFMDMNMVDMKPIADVKAKKETHGALISCSYYDCGGGIAYNNDSFEEIICKVKDGVQSITLDKKIAFGPQYRAEYRPHQDVLAAIGELVERENLAAWSELKFPMGTGLTSAAKAPNITLFFDDTSIGGEPCVAKKISISTATFCGGGNTVKEFHALLEKGMEDAEELSNSLKLAVKNSPSSWICTKCGILNTTKFCTNCGAAGTSENRR